MGKGSLNVFLDSKLKKSSQKGLINRHFDLKTPFSSQCDILLITTCPYLNDNCGELFVVEVESRECKFAL